MTNNIKSANNHQYSLKIYNGRVKIYIDGFLFVMFNQLEFLGLYNFKDDTDLYGSTIYMKGQNKINVYFKTKENWLAFIKIMDEKL